MIRTLDATPINAIASDPEVRPWLGGDPAQTPDLTAEIANLNNFAFTTLMQDGAYVLMKLQAGLYEVHTLALPPARGRPMLRLMRTMLRTMFTGSDAVEIVTRIPDGNENAMAWSDLAGFRSTYRREACFPLMGQIVGCQYRSLTFQDWALKDKEGHTLGEQFRATVRPLSNVQPDQPYDYMMGAMIGCLQNQNAVKGVGLFNRWAAGAGFCQAELKGLTPPTVDTGDAILSCLNGSTEVLKVHDARTGAS